MAGFLDAFRNKVISSVWKEKPDEAKVKHIDDKIALGVLLWIIAEADKKFLKEEEEEIKKILVTAGKIQPDELPAVLASVKLAAEERIDLYTFTHEVSANLSYAVKIKIIDNLFRVACIDKHLDNRELETIRKISGLFNLSHRDFIDAKLRIKKEFGL